MTCMAITDDGLLQVWRITMDAAGSCRSRGRTTDATRSCVFPTTRDRALADGLLRFSRRPVQLQTLKFSGTTSQTYARRRHELPHICSTSTRSCWNRHMRDIRKLWFWNETYGLFCSDFLTATHKHCARTPILCRVSVLGVATLTTRGRSLNITLMIPRKFCTCIARSSFRQIQSGRSVSNKVLYGLASCQ